MTILETWLKQATRHLSKDSAAQVRKEIQEHYESALAAGSTDLTAVSALGDAKTANRQYRKVLLTSAEARMLREGNCEARAVCSRPWLRWLFSILPIYTPSRGRIFRFAKWAVMIGTFGLAFGADALKWSWLLSACVWPVVWIEWTRVSIRRKLPVADWPKQLYL